MLQVPAGRHRGTQGGPGVLGLVHHLQDCGHASLQVDLADALQLQLLLGLLGLLLGLLARAAIPSAPQVEHLCSRSQGRAAHLGVPQELWRHQQALLVVAPFQHQHKFDSGRQRRLPRPARSDHCYFLIPTWWG